MLFFSSFRWNFKPLFLFLLVSLGTAQAQPAEEEAIKQSVQTMFVLLARGDSKAAESLWVENSKQFSYFEGLARIYATYQTDLQFLSPQFLRWNVKDNRAHVLVRFERKWRSKGETQQKEELLIWDIRFEKQNGIWRWSAMSNAYAYVINAFLKLKTAEEKALFLKQEQELFNTSLVGYINYLSVGLARGGDVVMALDYNEASIEICKVLGDKKTLASTLLNRAGFYLNQSRYESALQTYDRALPLFRETGDKRGEASVLSNIGVIYQSTGRYPEALEIYEKSLKITREIGDKKLEAGTIGNIGNVHQARGEYRAAMTQYQASLQVKTEIEDGDGIVITRNNIANVLTLTGHYQEALAEYEKSLSLARKSGNKRGEGLALGNIGLVYESMGRYGDALAQHQEALKLRRAIGDKRMEAETLNNIGLIYRLTFKLPEAQEVYKQSFAIARAIGDKALEAKIYNNYAILMEDADWHEDALGFYQESLKITRALGDKQVESLTLNNIANVLFSQQKYDEALKNYEAALAIMRATGNREDETSALNNIGLVYYQTARYEEALKQFRLALSLAEEIGAIESALRSYWGMGLVYRALRQWAQAAQNYQQATLRIETLRAQTKEQTLQAGLFERFASPYFYLAESLLHLNDAPGALQASEKAKARTLVDIMQNGKVDVQKNMTAEERKQEQKLNESLIAMNVQLTNAQMTKDSVGITAAKLQLNLLQGNYDDFRRQLYLRNPDLQTKRAQFAPATLQQLNQTLFRQEPDLCLLSYLISQDETLLFVITRGEETANLTVHRLPLKQDGLSKQISDFRLQCATADGKKRGFLFTVPPTSPLDYRKAARELYKLLLQPAEAELQGKKQIVILPDGVLHGLPFQTFIDGANRHFIEKFALSYAPSATALLKMSELSRQRNSSKIKASTLLAMGRPDYQETLSDLPATESEVKVLGDLFGEQAILLTGLQASEVKAKAEMPKARYLHFATHGLVNENAPMYSAIALTKGENNDGLLEAREMLDMNLQSDMVVLSACETALGRQTEGEGVLGLTWALFVAGTPTSVVSQWSVDDTSTGRLMVEFYRNLRANEELSKAEALRQAQLKMMQQKGYEHPFHWAPFVIIGDWR